jgi:hypothetical protein
MSSHLDYFSDLLEPGEQIRATLAGPGLERSGFSVWYQIAATESRLLVIELRSDASGTWRPGQRTSAPLAAVQMSRHQRTETEVARLEILGLDEAVTVVEIDQPEVFPMVEPLIVAWGGRLGGTGAERPTQTVEPEKPRIQNVDQQRWLIIALGCLGLLIAGCATAGCLGAIVASLESN